MSGPDYSTLNINNVSKIEILTGANSVTYGDKAIGGVINIILKTPSNPGLSSRYTSEISSFETNNSTLNLSYFSKKFLISSDLGYKKSDGYRKNSDLKAFNVGIDARYFFNLKNELRFNYRKYKDEYGLPGSLTKGEYGADRKQALYTFYSADYSTFTRNPSKDNVKTNFDQYVFSTDSRLGKFILNSALSFSDKTVTSEMVGYGKGKEDTDTNDLYLTVISIYREKFNELAAGLDYQNSSSKITSAKKLLKKDFAFFLSDNIKINNWLGLNAGFRNETIKLDIYSDKIIKYNKNALEFGIQTIFSSKGNVYVRVADGFRAPVTDEYHESFPKTYFNDSLKIQTNRDYEIGIRNIIKELGLLSVVFFKSETKNEIYYNPITFHNGNMPGKTERVGIDISAEHRLSSLFLKESASLLKSKILDNLYSNNEIPSVPQVTLSLIASYDFNNNIIVNASTSYVGSKYAVSDFTNAGGKVGSYWVTNINGEYKTKSLTFFAGIKNLFNAAYCEYIVYYGSFNYYPSISRNYYAGLSISY
jgi:iron complex outermembrane receptor protein